jgi:PAS domain S-box-containing protein
MSSPAAIADAQAVLSQLAGIFFQSAVVDRAEAEAPSLNVEGRYRAIVEQIPAVVFMAYLDEGIGEAYVSPQIEATLGFTQREWLEDPIRWYRQIHPDDKQRWSMEAAEMFFAGTALRSAYRVMARDGRVIWFHCEVKMMRRADGRPWFIHGVGFDISELKRTEAELQDERDVVSAILETVGALVVVLDPGGRIVRFNRACERTTGYSFRAVEGQRVWDLFLAPEDRDRFQAGFDQLINGAPPKDEESYWLTREGDRRLIRWSTTILYGSGHTVRYVIASGADITERKLLERTILDISGREQRRIGQDLHDGLGQHLTGIAFLSKVQEQRLAERSRPEAADAAKIVGLVNEAIHKTRELARGLLPVQSDAEGLMSALQQFSSEVEDLFQVRCRFESEEPVLVPDEAVANHLYRIAQEAVHNAIKHGKARNIGIVLRAGSDEGILSIRDDGSGIVDPAGSRAGMGLQIMRYRVSMIGGALEIARCADQGTLVTCVFPKMRLE